MSIPIFEVEKDAATAAARKVPVQLVNGAAGDYVTPWGGTTLSGSPKANLSRDFGSNESSDNAYTLVDGTNHPGLAALELSAAEVNDERDIIITINKGGAFGQTIARVVGFKPKQEGAASDSVLRHRAGKPG